jgi:hypothetical protein
MTRTIGLWSDSGEATRVYHSDEVELDFSDFTDVLESMVFSFVLAGDRRGRCFYAPVSSDVYEVFGFDGEGRAIFSVSRRLPRVPKTEEEMEDESAYIESWAARLGMQGVPIDWEPDPYKSFISALGVDGEGRLWVARSTGRQPLFDVFGPEGAHLFSARLPVPGKSWVFHMDRWGILCWDQDPPAGYQQIHVVEYPSAGAAGG